VLVEWVAGLSPAQHVAFDALVQAHVITVALPPSPGADRPGPSPFVDTTTVIGQPAVPAQSESAASQPPSAPNGVAAPAAFDELHADAENVPQGITVTVTAAPAGDRIDVRYSIHNGLAVSLADPHLVAIDGQGQAVAVLDAPAGAIAAGKDALGVLTVLASRFPVVLRWTSVERATETTLFVGYTVSRGTVQFDVAVTP